MKQVCIALFCLTILLSCAKSDSNIDNSEFKVASINHSQVNGPHINFDYYPDGKLKKYEYVDDNYGIYEYFNDSIVLKSYDISISDTKNELKYTKTYYINSIGFAISSKTIYPDKQTLQATYEYDSDGFLIRIVEGDWETINTIVDGNVIYTANYYNGDLRISESFEHYSDKFNKTNTPLFNCFDYDKTGANFLGKIGRNLQKKSVYTNATSHTYEYSYTFDAIGRVTKMAISTGNHFSITYVN